MRFLCVVAISALLSIITSAVGHSAILTHGPIVGATTPNSAKIFLRTNESAVVDIIYSANPDLSAFNISVPFKTTADTDFAKIFQLIDLTPSTVYYYIPRLNGIPALPLPYPSFTTFPSTYPSEFSFLVFTDFSDHIRPQWGNGPAIRSAGREKAEFALIGGDFSHSERQTLEGKRDIYKKMYDCNNTAQDLCKNIYRKMPIFHIWDDHDIGANNADKNYANKDIALQVYKEYMPAPPLANPNAGIWYSFRYGQAEFFMLDVRSQRDPNSDPDGPSKSMLDGNNLGVQGQLLWFKNALKSSTARWKFIMSGSVFNPTTKGPPQAQDSWGAFRTEHDDLVAFIKNNGINGVIVLSGDLHTGGAFDDGTNSGLIEFNVPHANLSPCFADTFVKVFGNWTYILSGYGNPGYGQIEVKTNPARVILNLKSYDGSLRKAWIIDENSMTSIDGPFEPIEDLGYFVWNDAARQTWGICWRGDHLEHHFEGEIITDATVENIKTIGLENSDTISGTSPPTSSIAFDAFALMDQDGISFKFAGESLTFNLKQDGGFHPEFITTGIDTLITGSWTRFRQNALHNGQSLYRGPQSSLLKWQYQTSERIFASTAQASDGTIYVAGLDGILRAFNGDGAIMWEFKTEGQLFSSPAIGIDGTVYIGSTDTLLYAISPNGALKWAFKTNGYIRSSPNISYNGSSIIFGSNDGYVYSVNVDGELEWRFYTGEIVSSSPAIGADGHIYVGSGNKLLALNPNGTIYWSFKTNGWIGASPVINQTSGNIYIGSWDGGFYSLTADGKLEWKVQTGGRIHSSAAISFDQTLYVGSVDEYLYAISQDGEIKWKFHAEGCQDCICHIEPPQHPNCNEIESSPAIDLDGTIYVGSHDNFLYAINPDGMLKWKFKANDWINSSPMIGIDGTIYFGSRDKNFYAIGH